MNFRSMVCVSILVMGAQYATVSLCALRGVTRLPVKRGLTPLSPLVRSAFARAPMPRSVLRHAPRRQLSSWGHNVDDAINGIKGGIRGSALGASVLGGAGTIVGFAVSKPEKGFVIGAGVGGIGGGVFTAGVVGGPVGVAAYVCTVASVASIVSLGAEAI